MTIIHYIYPHNPYPLAPEELEKPFDKLKNGNVSHDKVWGLYLENLRYVLDDIEILLDNFYGGKVVITSDHGEAFGEYGFYKHVIGCPLPGVRRVPWIETTARDKMEYEPKHDIDTLNEASRAEERLEALGYL